jgi:signal transduction histidine kinase
MSETSRGSMKKFLHSARWPASRRMRWLAVGLTLFILAGVIAVTTEQTRQRVRAQIAGRDGEVLHAVALMQQPDPAEVIGAIDDPLNQMVVVLQTSRLSTVIGARLFDADGIFVEAFPVEVLKGHLAERDLEQLTALRPVSHFRPAVAPSQIFLPETQDSASPGKALPVLEVNVPLHAKGERRLLGVGQFLVQGHAIAQEFARLNQHLLRQAIVAFLASGALLAAAIWWSFRRLDRAHRLLAERTANLLAANRELALAAKTSAVGAVTAHLLHGLKNPLAGLQTFVANLGGPMPEPPDADRQQALATTRRMQAMINDVVSVLREENGGGHYEVTLDELASIISGRVQAAATRHGVFWSTEVLAVGILPNRVANLVALILANLSQNGIEVTPRGGTVRLTLRREGESVVAEVRDQGPGFPPGQAIFAPCQSSKEGGSGIGLAISKQLANHLGASLELMATSEQGSSFVLTLGAEAATGTALANAGAVTVTTG